jgi:hypothetical protein
VDSKIEAKIDLGINEVEKLRHASINCRMIRCASISLRCNSNSNIVLNQCATKVTMTSNTSKFTGANVL